MVQGENLAYSYDRRDAPAIGLEEQPTGYRNMLVMKRVRGELFAWGNGATGEGSGTGRTDHQSEPSSYP